ncbi:MAG: hypothetical protein M3Z24_04450, partial [Chloroflexota bacterium]|nr:hypothetical protein [Chloroflexota bacterium]
MASVKRDRFGVRGSALLSMLRQSHHPTIVSLSDEEPDVVLIKTAYLILRTIRFEAMTVRYALSDASYDISHLRQGWQMFEGLPTLAPLHVTNKLLEATDGLLARKLVTEDGKAVYIAKTLLDVYGSTSGELACFLFESVKYSSDSVA